MSAASVGLSKLPLAGWAMAVAEMPHATTAANVAMALGFAWLARRA